MKLEIYSYRYAQEILEHPKYSGIWKEIQKILTDAPVFIYPGKSKNNANLSVVQQVMNTYFDRKFSVDSDWEYHPLATKIPDSGLAADYRKKHDEIAVQAEVQFGNMSRWYSDIFKFQTAYSQSLVQVGLSIVPMADLAKKIDSNVVNFERALRELPSAEMSITLPILLVGVAQDSKIVDLSQCKFGSIKELNRNENRWRIVNAYLKGKSMASVDEDSDTGPMLDSKDDDA